MKKEIRSLTGVRGVAALFVAYYHFLEPHETNVSGVFLPFIKHGYNSVDLFFILSGFVLTLSSQKLFEGGVKTSNYLLFMKRRFARIYPIYIVLILLSMGLILVFKYKEVGLSAVFAHLFLLQVLFPVEPILAPSWSLSAEWITYLYFPFLLALLYKYKSRGWDILWIIAGLGLLLFVALNNSEFFNGWQPVPTVLNGNLDRFRGLSAILRCLSGYIFGISLYKLYSSYYNTHSKYYHYGALPSFLLILLCLFVPNSDLILVILFAILIFSLSTDKGILAGFMSSKPIYFLGEISYSLYLVHPILTKIDQLLYKRLLSHHIKYLNPINVLSFTLVLIAAAYISYRFIEVPARNYLKPKPVVV